MPTNKAKGSKATSTRGRAFATPPDSRGDTPPDSQGEMNARPAAPARPTQRGSIKPTGTGETAATDDLESRLLTYAEQLGRMVGQVQNRTEGWLDRRALAESLSRVRDGAKELLTYIPGIGEDEHSRDDERSFREKRPPQEKRSREDDRRGNEASSTKGRPASRAAQAASGSAAPNAKTSQPRSGGKVDAPGKRHRAPLPSVRGVKHSDERVAKQRAADMIRKRGARGGRG